MGWRGGREKTEKYLTLSISVHDVIQDYSFPEIIERSGRYSSSSSVLLCVHLFAAGSSVTCKAENKAIIHSTNMTSL